MEFEKRTYYPGRGYKLRLLELEMELVKRGLSVDSSCMVRGILDLVGELTAEEREEVLQAVVRAMRAGERKNPEKVSYYLVPKKHELVLLSLRRDLLERGVDAKLSDIFHGTTMHLLERALSNPEEMDRLVQYILNATPKEDRRGRRRITRA